MRDVIVTYDIEEGNGLKGKLLKLLREKYEARQLSKSTYRLNTAFFDETIVLLRKDILELDNDVNEHINYTQTVVTLLRGAPTNKIEHCIILHYLNGKKQEVSHEWVRI